MSITHVSVSRVSDNRNNISWGYDSTQIGSVTIQRSSNGGGYSSLASPSPSSSSYADTSTQANSWYRYRMQTVEYWISGPTTGSFVTDWVYSGTVYNAPSAPGKPTAVRLSTSSVRISFTNGGRTQTATEIQRSTDKINWTTIRTLSGSNVTQMDDDPGGGASWYYRARNTRGSLVSAWSPASDVVATITPPAAPTAIFPFGVISKSDSSITFTWQHNPIDGTQQTEAQVRYSTNWGSTWQTITVYGASSTYTMSNDFSVGAQVLWQARTRGLHASYSEWASASVFYVYQVPQVSLQLPISPITEMPIDIQWEYDDESGVQIAATATLSDSSGMIVYSESLSGTGTTLAISSAEFLPRNGEVYTLTIQVHSSSSLTATTSTEIEMDYDEPLPPTGTVSIIEDVGGASLAVFAAESYMLQHSSTWELGGTSDAGDWATTDRARTGYLPIPPGATTLSLAIKDAPPGYAFDSVRFYNAPGSHVGATGPGSVGFPGPLTVSIVGAAKFFRVTIGQRIGGIWQEIDPVDLADIKLYYSDKAIDWEEIDLDLNPGDYPDTVSVGIYRRYADGRIVSLVDHAPSGTAYYDAYPPLDMDFEYVFVSYAETGAAAEYAVPAYIPSNGGVFFNYGDGFRSVAMVVLDVRYDNRLEHSHEIYETAGNPRPLIFYGEGESETGMVSGTALKDPSMLDIPEESSIDVLRSFSRNKDAAIFRCPGGEPILVNATVALSRYHEGQLTNTWASVSIDWTRVREDNGLAI